MRPLGAVLAVLMICGPTGCDAGADEGNLTIRCPDARNAVAVTDGRVTVDAVAVRVAADLSVPVSLHEGMKFAIDVELPASAGATAPAVQCVRITRGHENLRWDATPSRIEEVHDGSTVRVRSMRGEGPHWGPDELVDVTVWLKIGSVRHVLTLQRQPIRSAG